MFTDFSWILLFGILVVMAESLATGLMEDVSKADQVMRPKAKRVQELLMFGNQQNRRADNIAAAASSDAYTSNAEKRTLSTSGLEDVKAALAADENFGRSRQLSNSMYDRDEFYGYGKDLGNDVVPRNWNLPPFDPYSIVEEDRRKRSEKSANAQVPTTTTMPTTTTTTSTTTSSPSFSQIATTQNIPEPVAQAKRSIPIYQEPRFKRGLDRDEFLTLLSLWQNSPRNRNWRNYGSDEYENVEDDGGVVGLDEEDPRNDGAWMAVEPSRHFNTAVHGPQAVSPFDIGIPRTHPVNSYDQYENQYATPYESTQYDGAQYGALYPSQSYYSPEKRYLVARKRSQGYDSYNGRNDLATLSRMLSSQPQVYPNYPHRLIY